MMIGCFQECEKEVKTATDGDSEDQKKESIMRLSWSLVHSRQAEDIQRGIAMLEGIQLFASNESVFFKKNYYYKA